MSNVLTLAVLLCLALATPAAPAQVATIPGKNAVAVATDGQTDIDINTPVVLSGQIVKAKSKRILIVNAAVRLHMDRAPAGGNALGMVAKVNGTVLMQPFLSTGGWLSSGPPTPFPSVAGVWWLDLDANPTLIGQPLDITLRLTNSGTGPDTIDAAFTAVLQKK